MTTFLLDLQEARIKRLRRSVLTAARLVQTRPASGVRWVPVMVTLTYAPGQEWAPKDISGFVQTVRAWGRRAGYSLPIMWVLELQKRGAPHYHVLVWIPRRLRLPRADARGWWKKGSTNTLRAKNAYGYLAKYASKGFQDDEGELPKGARLYGVSGLSLKERHVVAWWHLPKRLRTGAEGSVYWRRMPGGAWEESETGALEFAIFRAGVLSKKYVSLTIDPLSDDDKRWRYHYASAALEEKHAAKRRNKSIVRGRPDWLKLAEVEQYERYERERARLSFFENANRAELVQYWEAVERGEIG